MIPPEVLTILVPLVQSSEGCRLQSYQDGAGVWTIGYGHTGTEVLQGLVWTQDQADAALTLDLNEHYTQLLKVTPGIVDAIPGQQASITDFVYNLGIGTYIHSTLRSAVTVGAWKAAADQLSLWVHSGGKVEQGLVTRRNKEIALLGV